jgi:hypothetical protein
MTEQQQNPEEVEVVVVRRSLPERLSRVGCVVVWLTAMMIPFVLIILAARGEIIIPTGDAPDQRIRLWLIMEPYERGVGISRAAVIEVDDLSCVQTDVSFLLWEGQAEEGLSYCECYSRSDDEWNLQTVAAGSCPVP